MSIPHLVHSHKNSLGTRYRASNTSPPVPVGAVWRSLGARAWASGLDLDLSDASGNYAIACNLTL